ncbi:LEAF RUST 10 DISEASE-RESISTANCE LOCUS RECEPTOR-LIKE PROTEIN KINASE-like 2.5 [Bidens hawaiensis]|uniref:LEAF RUST 10 DISEASE-RESISTANCE LOCUS RECEPTOR-LIKE PROTEIN KINASE-like 2.5 n=1 Tax=Bidens hawaiensis TaxID=980011 RepID=UPI004049509B
MEINYSIILILFVLSHSLQSVSSQDEGNSSRPICPASFSCLNLGYLSFPFYTSGNSACGLCEVDCSQPVAKIRLKQDSPSYDLVKVMPGSSDLFLVQDNYYANQINSNSCDSLTYVFPSNSFSISYSISPTFPVLRCSKSPRLREQVDGYFRPANDYYVFDSCDDYNYYYAYSNVYISSNTDVPSPCQVVVLPVKPLSTFPKETNLTELFKLLTYELELVVQVSDRCQECHRSGGRCSTQSSDNQEFWCENNSRNTKKEKPRNIVIKSSLATLAAGSVILLILIAICSRFKIFSRHDAENYSNIEAIIKNHESLAPKRYSYSNVKKMTNSFRVKVGEGGYGSVYRGSLQNGNEVAVKVLNELKGSGQDLVNELASISKTCHVNIVSLLGFCFEGRHRALIYEYMPNGSLEKFIHDPSSATSTQLEWKKLYDITVGIARGLEYLHRGCNTRILHFDIKPHNILLDKDLCPKISDFGLAKLCTEKRSVVSMSGMRGTPGYIAPEVFSRNFGVVSHKSDVYSYGMMVLEMVGGRRNVVAEDDGTSNMYFFDFVYRQVMSNKDLGLSGVLGARDKEVAKKMVLVSLWCTQSDPASRPSMSKVLDMLEGDLKCIQIPPKPFLYSTPRSLDSHQ